MNSAGDTPTQGEEIVVNAPLTLVDGLSMDGLISAEQLELIGSNGNMNLHKRGNSISPKHVVVTTSKPKEFEVIASILDARSQHKTSHTGFTVWTIENGQIWMYEHPVLEWTLEFRFK